MDVECLFTVDECRKALEDMHLFSTSSWLSIPKLVKSRNEVMALPLDHRAGLVLSLEWPTTTVEEIDRRAARLAWVRHMLHELRLPACLSRFGRSSNLTLRPPSRLGRVCAQSQRKQTHVAREARRISKPVVTSRDGSTRLAELMSAARTPR